MLSDRKDSLRRKITDFGTLAVILLLTVIQTYALAQSRSSSNQLTMKSAIPSKNLKIIGASKKGAKKGSVVIEIWLKNISQKEISLRETYVLNDYSFVVKGRDGEVLSPSEEGRMRILESRMISHRDIVVLQPGEKVTRELVITDVYNFRPGEVYKITIERRISLDKGKTFEEAQSNIIRAKIDG